MGCPTPPSIMKPTRLFTLAAALYALPLAAQNVAQQDAATDPKAILAAERYQKPPAVVERIVAANRSANISLGNPSPDHKWFMRVENDGLPSLDDFANGHIYLGGLQVDTAGFRARSLTTRPNRAISIIEGATGKARSLDVLPGADVSAASWSPDGKMIAYVASTPKATHLAVIDVATGKSTQLTKTPINAVWYLAGGGGGGGFGGGGPEVQWTADSKNVVAVMVPQPMKAKPVEPAVATTPIVRMTNPGVMQKESIHPSLLTTPYDMSLLEFYSMGQLALIDVKTKAVKNIGSPARVPGVRPSPDGRAFRVTLLDKPFSYIVPTSNFGTEEQLWDATGKMIVQINKRPLRSGTRITDSTQQVADSIAQANAGVDPMLKGKTILGWDPAGGGMYLVAVDPAADSAARASASANAGRGAGRGNGGGGGGRGAAQGGGPQVPSKLQHWAPPYNTGVFH